MALIGKIRNNMWLVFIIIGLATAAFILMDASGPGGGGFGGPNANTPIGVVAGQKIKQPEFERAYQALFTNSETPNASREALWNFIVENGIVTKEAEDLGMYIGEEELEDLQFGSNLSPIIRANFTNRQTGQLDVAQLQQIKSQLENDNGDPQLRNLRNFWNEQLKQIKKEQLQTKLSNLAQKAIYTPNWLAERGFKEENGTFDIAMVKIPFDNMNAGDISVSDKDITAYIAKNKETYELKEENRKLSYMTYEVLPSAADSVRILERMNDIISGFRTTTNDSIYAISNNGFYSNGYGKPSQIDEFYSDKVGSYEIGGVYGPYILGNSYQAAKLIDRRSIPDSVKARHILKRVDPAVTGQLEQANALIDSLMTVLNRNRSKFSDLAAQFSDDGANKNDGGDLGYFAQGSMVKPFNDLCFIKGKERNLYKVRTSIGVHLIVIEDRKFVDNDPGYKMAYVTTPIIPGDETETAKYNVMIELISSYPYLSDLKSEVAKHPEIIVSTSPNLGPNDYNIQELGADRTTRDLVKWAFNGSTNINDVSQTVYEYSDPINYFTNKYVIVGLESISTPGLPNAADLRSQVEFTVLNNLKGEKTLTEISGSDLSVIATKYGVRVDTINNLNLLNNFTQGLGNEPKVLGVGSGQENGSVSSPMLGNSGVFVIKTLRKTEAGAITDLGFIKNKMASNKRSGLQFSLIEALKGRHEVKDNRATFY